MFIGLINRRVLYLSHIWTIQLSSVNVKVFIRCIVFLQISFFVCWQLCWIRGFCISFTSSFFLFPVGGRGELEVWGLGVGIKNFRTGWLCYVMLNLFTVGSLQFCSDNTITSLEANLNRPKIQYYDYNIFILQYITMFLFFMNTKI